MVEDSKAFKGILDIKCMKKILSLLVLSLFVLSAIGGVSAKTLIAGKIYNADYSDTIAGADVIVSCARGSVTNVQNITSESDGQYDVTFSWAECHEEDIVTVSAIKDGLYGSKTGVVHDVAFGTDWDLAVVNVPLVPEFGVIVGVLTIFGAMVVFFVIRRD